MATIKARGCLASIGVRIPGEHVAGQILKFESDADLPVGNYAKADQPQRTGTLSIGLPDGQIEVEGKLLVRDFPPETAEGMGERHLIFRPGAPLQADEIGKLLKALPSNAEERDGLSVNLTFSEEQKEMFEDK